MDILKNPIVIGIILGVLVYLYLLWDNDKKYKNSNGKEPKKDVNIGIPLIVAIVGAVASYGYFNNSFVTNIDKNVDASINKLIDVESPQQLTGGGQINNSNSVPVKLPSSHTSSNTQFIKPSKSITDFSSDNALSYVLTHKGINIPNNIPDVFIETY